MASNHDDVSSEEEGQATSGQVPTVTTDDESVSSEENGVPTPAEAAEDEIEDGFDIATHGGGSIESVEGFELTRAMTEGFESDTLEIDEDLKALPQACNLEFDEPESVCGRDDRVRITRTSAIPWRMLCQLIITRRDNRRSRCTGWFIGPRTIMTAGHCVFSRSGGGWARSIEVIPGMNANARPFGAGVGTSFRSVTGWTRNQRPEYDYGAIILPNNRLGNQVGWFGFARLSDASLRNLLVNNSGYAGDKPFGTQWFNAGRITKVTNRRLQYMIDTFGGHSGSPVWRHANGKRHAVGVHAYGGCPNKSTRITKGVFENMKKWKALGT